jgi:hypothetical protein
MTARTLGRYQLTERLGRGGMGEVWRARDPALRRDVAVKVLRRDDVENDATLRDDFVQRFLREARAAASLKHPNVVAIHDVGVDAEPYIVMEWVEGAPLRGFIGDPSIPVAQRIEWLVEIARALAAAHELGLVHRDIKPDNVMITKDGHAKVLDFGIAKLIGTEDAPVSQKEAPESFRTQQGRIVGTPKYMAPEQLRGDAIDARVDQWAWACVAYELLTGSMPDRDEVPQPISLTVPEVPFDVAAAIVRARSVDPDKRFDSMRALLAAFAVQPSGEVTVSVAPARRDPDAPTTTGPVRRSWTRVALVALASFALAGVAVFAWKRQRVTPIAPAPAAPGCTLTMLPDTPLGALPDHFFAPAQPIAGGLVLAMARTEQGVHVEQLITVTQDSVTTRVPPPPNVTTSNPTSLFVLAASNDVRHYLVYGYEQSPLIIGRTVSNDTLADVFRINNPEGFRAYEIAGFYSSHVRPSTLEFLVFGNDSGRANPLGTTLRLFGRGTYGQVICEVDAAHQSIGGLVVVPSEHHAAYTYVIQNEIFAGSFAIQSHIDDQGMSDIQVPVETTKVVDLRKPVPLGELSSHPGRAFEGETFHVVWPELGQSRLRHASVRTDDMDAGAVIEDPIAVPTDGSSVDLRFAGGTFALAWHDGAHVYYGEGPNVRAAASKYGRVPDANVSSGPWIAQASKLVTWMSGANNVVRRAIVSCR